jgi:hypothetical protein
MSADGPVDEHARPLVRPQVRPRRLLSSDDL